MACSGIFDNILGFSRGFESQSISALIKNYDETIYNRKRAAYRQNADKDTVSARL